MIDFVGINRAALSVLPSLLDRWLPGGRREGREYTVRNPRRADRRPGSFRINLNTGRWADFATGDRRWRCHFPGRLPPQHFPSRGCASDRRHARHQGVTECGSTKRSPPSMKPPDPIRIGMIPGGRSCPCRRTRRRSPERC